jgi:hypothetical protein
MTKAHVVPELMDQAVGVIENIGIDADVMLRSCPSD